MADGRNSNLKRSFFDPEHQRRNQLVNIPLLDAPSTFNDVLAPYLEPATQARLFITRVGLSTLYQKNLHNSALNQLLQAVTDDDREKVKRILNGNPALLLAEPPENLVINSQYTWQKFRAENAWTIAIKRKQIEMIKILLPYFDKLEQTDILKEKKQTSLLQWSFYEKHVNALGQYEITVPKLFTEYLESLIYLFSLERFPNGSKITDKMSDETEEVLQSFRNMMLPREVLELDYIDIELFLYSAYKSYCDNFNMFKNFEQRDAFFMKVIGFIQSLVTPETAKIFCESLYYVVEKNKKIGKEATMLRFANGESFYRSSRDTCSSLGFEYVCGCGDEKSPIARSEFAVHIASSNPIPCWMLFEKFCEAKANCFRHIQTERKQPGCTLL